jgi:hypothetical protein
MKSPSFLQGALTGLVISVAAALLFSLLTLWFDNDLVIRCLITAAGLIYIIQLIKLSGEPIGRLTTISIWSAVSLVLLWTEPPLIFYLLTNILLIWLVRSLYFYSSTLPSIGDLALSLLSLSAAVWAAMQTGNVFLSFWCFFLMQALWSAIPRQLKSHQPEMLPTNDRFQEAYRNAEVAVGKILSIH